MRTTAPERDRWRSRVTPRLLAVLVNSATLVLMMAAVFHRGGEGTTYPGTAQLLFTILGWLPLLARTRWPVPVLAITATIAAAQIVLVPLLDPHWATPVSMAVYQPVPIAVVVAAFTVAVRTRRSVGWATGAATAIALPLVAWIVHPGEDLWTDLVMCNLILDGTAAGVLVAGRRDRLARDAAEQEERTRREVVAERLRIARELHDVLAHHLTLINAQAGVADYLVRTDPEAAATALRGMARHTSQALDEVRATVGLLREDAEEQTDTEAHPPGTPRTHRAPLPTLERLPHLLDAVRAAGTHVELQVHGVESGLAPGADLAAYRVLQEALTNATRHAPGEPVRIVLDWDDSQVRIRVQNRLSPTPGTGGSATRSGHGLLGMAERIKAAGGTLAIDSATEGSDLFVVRAALPTDTATRPLA